VVSVDALDLEQAVASGDLEAAASLYSGPFMDGVHVKDAPEFEKWVDSERERLASVHREVLEGLATAASEGGRRQEAAEWWKKLAVQDPYSDRIALGLMEALSEAGDRAGALRYAQVHATLLREDFGTEPGPDVAELERRIREEVPAEAMGQPPSPPAERPAGQAERAGQAESAGRAEEKAQGPVLGVEPSATEPLFQRLAGKIGKQRMVQWLFAYLAGAWFILQLLDATAEAWGLSLVFQRAMLVLLIFGFFVAVVVAWYHGEKGRQRVSGPELLIIASLLVIAGGVLAMNRSGETPPNPSVTVESLLDSDPRPTIAVLPFDNHSPDPADSFFADGMQEEILSKLANVSSLRVISRSSTMQFREDRPSVREMAEMLGADFFLEGSARIAGGLVRLTAQLIDASSDDHVWEGTFDRPLQIDSLIAVQSDIADSVASQMRATLTPEERDRISHSPTDNLEAYQLYLRGRFLWSQRTDPDMRRAVSLFQEVIEMDSMYAYAYVGLADAYLTLQLWHFMGFDDAIPPAEEALQRALAINPDLGEAHASLGTVLESRADIPGAIAAFQRSFELAPNHATGHHWYALLMAKQGHFDDALTHIRYAAGLDPLSRMIDQSWGYILQLSRRHAEAAVHLEGVTNRVPDFALAWLRLGEAYAFLGRYEDALTAMGRAVELEPYPNFILELAWVHAMEGNRLGAQAILDQNTIADPLRRAQIHGALGETDLALQALEEGIQLRSPTVQYLGVDPMWDPIRSDPGFQAVLTRLGFRQAGS
jgi:TolB-like protein/cytochrome c-type biogenesis protein CcmH/NrfG